MKKIKDDQQVLAWKVLMASPDFNIWLNFSLITWNDFIDRPEH